MLRATMLRAREEGRWGRGGDGGEGEDGGDRKILVKLWTYAKVKCYIHKCQCDGERSQVVKAVVCGTTISWVRVPSFAL